MQLVQRELKWIRFIKGSQAWGIRAFPAPRVDLRLKVHLVPRQIKAVNIKIRIRVITVNKNLRAQLIAFIQSLTSIKLEMYKGNKGFKGKKVVRFRPLGEPGEPVQREEQVLQDPDHKFREVRRFKMAKVLPQDRRQGLQWKVEQVAVQVKGVQRGEGNLQEVIQQFQQDRSLNCVNPNSWI